MLRTVTNLESEPCLPNEKIVWHFSLFIMLFGLQCLRGSSAAPCGIVTVALQWVTHLLAISAGFPPLQ